MGLMDIISKGVSFIPGVGPVASTALDVASGLAKKSATDTAGKEQQAANIAGGKLQAAVSEDKRLAHAGLGAGLQDQVGAAGFMTLPDEVLQALKARRNYDPMIEKAYANPAAGSGAAFLSGLFGRGAETIGQHEMNQEGVGVPSPEPVGVPGGVGTAADPALAGGSVDTELKNPLEYDPNYFKLGG